MSSKLVRSRTSLFVIAVLALLIPVFVPGQINARSAVDDSIGLESRSVPLNISNKPVPARSAIRSIASCNSDSNKKSLVRISVPVRIALGAPVPIRYASPEEGDVNYAACQGRSKSCGSEQLGCYAPWVPTWCGPVTSCCARCCYPGTNNCGAGTQCGGGDCTC